MLKNKVRKLELNTLWGGRMEWKQFIANLADSRPKMSCLELGDPLHSGAPGLCPPYLPICFLLLAAAKDIPISSVIS